ncbi:MAG: M28 family peptidase [Candidatus Jordarchaeum sp.]|uniref:M28 family peptidase n=1 Tax=Candidatus Jordarchaeum sp. TaxID=2823881 RepID=UPI00404A25E8
MWKRGATLILVSFILILMVSVLFASVSSSPAFTAQSSNNANSCYVPKSVVNAAYLTNQSTVQKWEKYFTSSSLPANLQDTVGYLSGLGTRHPSKPECNTSANYIFTQLQSYGYTPLRDYFTIMWQGTPYITQNIYCVKPSSSPEIILLACHYDSIRALRIGTTVYGIQNTNCPGAADDAAGVAVLLETARLLADVNLERTLVFVFLSGEEGNSTIEHWFGSQQLINQGYSLFTTQFSNIKRVIYLDTLGEPPYGAPRGNITIYSILPVFSHTTSLIGAASDLGVSVVSQTNPRASTISEAQKQFCSEWKLQSVLPTVTISQGNWNITLSDRLTERDIASQIDYTFVNDVTKIVTGAMVREFFTLPLSSPSYKNEWYKLASINPYGINLFEKDYTEYLASPSSDVIIIGPELDFKPNELQNLIALGKPIICTGESGVRLLNSLGAQVTGITSYTDIVSLTRVDLFYHPIWENVEENITVMINRGQSTLITTGNNLFSFLEYGGDCWLGFYYGNQSLKYVFYVGRDNPANLSNKGKQVLSNLIFWSAQGQEYILQLQSTRIVAGQINDLTMAIRSALSWDIVKADTVNLTITQNGKEVFRNPVSTLNGFFSVSLSLDLGECVFTASSGTVSATRVIRVLMPFKVQAYSPLFSVQNQFFVLALRIDSLSSSEQNLGIFIPELQVFNRINLHPNQSVVIYVPAVYNPASPYDQGFHMLTVLVQGAYQTVSFSPMWIYLEMSSLILGYIIPLIAILAVSFLIYRKIYLVKLPEEIRFRETKRRERRSYFKTVVLDSDIIGVLREYLKKRGFREKAENRFYNSEMIIEIENKSEESQIKVFSLKPILFEKDLLELTRKMMVNRAITTGNQDETLINHSDNISEFEGGLE